MAYKDTNELSDIFNVLLNDNCFVLDHTGIPVINEENAGGSEFLNKYIEYCQQIETDRIVKIRDMLSNLGFNVNNCARELVEKMQALTKNCILSLSEHEKLILEKDSNTKNYADVPNYETVRKWLSKSDAREPSRWSLYQIAFALGLKAYFPEKISLLTPEEYQTSVNYLFNKVYNQRFVTRTAHELIFIFCLLHEKSYADALKMYCLYIEGCRKKYLEEHQPYIHKENNGRTLFFVQKGIDNSEQGFIDDLIELSPLLEDKYSSVFDKIDEWKQDLFQEDSIDNFESYNNENLTVSKDIFISRELKRNFQLLDGRMRIISALYENPMNKEDENLLIAKLNKLNVTNEQYQRLKEYGEYSISAIFGKGIQPFFSRIIDDVIVTGKEMFAHRIENEQEIYEWRMDIYRDLSHNLIYRNLRKALITIHFFRYWSDRDRDVLEYDDYIGEINEILTDYSYLPLYLKNSYDCFFMLCAKTCYPIETYYTVFNEIFEIYSSVNIPSSYYAPLQADELIFDFDTLLPIDKNNVQKKVLKAIQEISRGQN